MSSEHLLQIPGLRIERPVHESLRTVVYRAIRHDDGQAVAVKCPRSEYPSVPDLARFRNEFDVTRQITSANVIRADRLGTLGSRAFLVSPYFDGVPLARLMGESLPLADLLNLMLHILRAVSDIHEAGVVHKDLSPTNILVDPSLQSVRIIDFGIASRLQREHQEAVAPSALEGTLRYISPEQTGRMNRSVDYRADFYSLGAIFYELLAGTPVFEGEDATELVHHHIAKRPHFPLRVRQQIPGPVREVVLKLLVKTPEERYQSAAGVERDLLHCLEELRRTGDIVPFTLGEEDASDRFVVAQRLYGREAESELMLDAFAEVSAGKKRILLLTGPSGIGKSALVREVHRSILEKRGYFASGRADQLRHNIPYAAVSQAMREVARQILSEGEEARASWRRRIAEAVGPGARALADLVPELGAITGPLPGLPHLEPQESQNRLREAFRRLIGLLASEQHPLVLFLDDLQWVDSAALGLLRALLLDGTVTHLLFIGAYRDAEVGPAHPTRQLFAEAREAGSPPTHIPLGPLSSTDVAELVSDTLRTHSDEVGPLAHLIHQRTEGNAFFVGEYLGYLHREGLISFQRSQGAWTWDLSTIHERGISDGLVELVRAKIRKTPPATREALQIGACIGDRFDLETLAVVTGQEREALGEALVVAVRDGIVTLLGASHQLGLELRPLQNLPGGPAVTFSFVHDRVREAAYQLLDPDEQRRWHLQIARVLRGSAEEPPEGRLYQVVDHLNCAWELIDSPAERRSALRLNLIAARLAKLNAAYDVALRCLRHAMAALPADAWQRQFELTRDLYLERAECEYLGGGRELVEEIIATALRHVEKPVERAAFYAVAIPLKTNQGQPREAIAIGAEALRRLGVDLPAEPRPEAVKEALLETRARLEALGRTALLDLPRMVDPEKLAILRLLNRMGPPAYFSDPGLYALMHCRIVGVSLTHGHASESVRGYSVYGMILATHDQLYEEARHYGELAIELADRLGGVHMKGVSRMLFGCFISHWSRDAEPCLDLINEAYRYLREAGDIVLASFALCFHTVILFIQGAPLARVQAAAAESMGYLRGASYRDLTAMMDCLGQTARALEGATAGPTRLDDDRYREAHAREAMRGFNIKTPLHYYLISKMQLHYLFGELEAAAELIPLSQQLLPLSWGALYTAEHVFYSGLCALALCSREGSTGAEREAHRRAAATAQEQLRVCALSAPGNFMAKHLLLEAEAARVDGEHDRALELYDGALEVARERQNLQVEALAAELAGKYHLRLCRRLIAGAYLKHAHYAYSRWGASAKAAELQSRYPSLLGLVGAGARGTVQLENDATIAEGLEHLDIAAITKATHAIAEEIVLDKLVTKFMRILVENAGAEHGCLIFPRPNGLQILVRAHIDDAAGATLVDEPLARSVEVVPTIVDMVQRSERHVLYEDAARTPELLRDPVVKQRSPRSVLCFPVMHLGRLSCIVYLENNLSPGVFTGKHVEVLRMLSAQAAISIENAHLYAGLQEKIAELEQAQRHSAERERLKKEMEIAERIQTGILPRGQEIQGLEIAASMVPCTEVGGDYYDVIPTAAGCWIGVGDVAGHGLESGLSMLMIQSGVATLVRRDPQAAPHELLRVLNEMLFENIRKRLGRDDHATMVLMRCHDSGEVSFAGAHEDIVLCRAADGNCELIETRGAWLGAIKSLPSTMGTSSFTLLPGDLMLLYTDGIIEARNAAREQFGIVRLQSELRRVRDKPAETIRDHLTKVLARFAPQLDDDVTLLVIRYRGKAAA